MLSHRGVRTAVSERPAAHPIVAPFPTERADLGVPGVNLDRALALAADLEDEELVRRMRRGA